MMSCNCSSDLIAFGRIVVESRLHCPLKIINTVGQLHVLAKMSCRGDVDRRNWYTSSEIVVELQRTDILRVPIWLIGHQPDLKPLDVVWHLMGRHRPKIVDVWEGL